MQIEKKAKEKKTMLIYYKRLKLQIKN
jgi:hypothetical protein